MKNGTNTFGETLKRLRIEAGFSQITLAEKLQVSKCIVSYWENNLSEPTLSNLKKIALLFNVSIDYLAGLED